MAIHIKPSHRGKFTRAAERAGKGVQEYAREEAHNPNASPALRKEAVFAENAGHHMEPKSHWNRGGRVGRKKGSLRARMHGHNHHPEHKKV